MLCACRLCHVHYLPVVDDVAAVELVAVVGLRCIHLCTVSLAVQLTEETARLTVERTVDVLVVNMLEEEDRDSRWVQVGLLLHRMQVDYPQEFVVCPLFSIFSFYTLFVYRH